MKKTVIFISVLLVKLLFRSESWPLYCKSNSLSEREINLTSADYAGGNGTIISELENSEQKITVRKHFQKITIGNCVDDERRLMFSSVNDFDLICQLQDNDKIEITEIWYIITKEDNVIDIWLKIDFNGTYGFLNYDRTYYSNNNDKTFDPYKNDTWKILKLFDDGWTARKISQLLAVYSDENELELRDRPGEKNSRIIAHIPSSYKKIHEQINVEVLAVTEEIDEKKDGDRWVYIKYKEKSGWIYGGYLSAERGGPKYYIPQDCIEFTLGGY